MNDNRSFTRWVLLVLLLVFAMSVLFWILLPARLLDRTLDTTNVITSYERFIDLNANFEARLAQVNDLRAQGVSTPEDRTDLNTVTQSCREIAADYNADSTKFNKRLFMDHNLPPTLDAARCTGENK